MTVTSNQREQQAAERPLARLVEIAGARVDYATFTLGPVDLDVHAGEILCVVGPNGAGKTTLLRAASGLLPLASGEVRLGGESVAGRPPRVLRRIGWVPDEEDDILGDLTCTELWELHAYAHARVDGSFEPLVARARELAERLDFVPPRTLVASFSHGMKKKAQIVAGLMHEPDFVIFDEPRNGLDPIAIDRLERLVDELRASGRAIVIATHDLHYAQRVADRVAVLRGGQVAALGTPDALADGAGGLPEAFLRLVEPQDGS